MLIIVAWMTCGHIISRSIAANPTSWRGEIASSWEANKNEGWHVEGGRKYVALDCQAAELLQQWACRHADPTEAVGRGKTKVHKNK